MSAPRSRIHGFRRGRYYAAIWPHVCTEGADDVKIVIEPGYYILGATIVGSTDGMMDAIWTARRLGELTRLEYCTARSAVRAAEVVS